MCARVCVKLRHMSCNSSLLSRRCSFLCSADGQFVCFGKNHEICSKFWQSQQALFILVQCGQMVSLCPMDGVTPQKI